MSQFYCRENELRKLNKRYEGDKFECIVIYGRRRVGKTALINEFCKGKPTIFFSAFNTTGKENLEALSKSIMTFERPDMESAPEFRSYDAALDELTALSKEKRMVFVIDEYPYLAKAKPVKLRTMQNNNHMESFSALGANPTPVAFSELYISLSQKVVDAQENPIANVTDKKLYEVQKYLSLTNHIYDAMPLVCNLEFFNSLPQAYQKVVQAGAIYAQEFSRFCNLEREDLILADLADKYGMQINEVSADARAEMAKVAQPAVIKLVAKDIGQDAVDQYMNDVKDVLAQISKF